MKNYTAKKNAEYILFITWIDRYNFFFLSGEFSDLEGKRPERMVSTHRQTKSIYLNWFSILLNTIHNHVDINRFILPFDRLPFALNDSLALSITFWNKIHKFQSILRAWKFEKNWFQCSLNDVVESCENHLQLYNNEENGRS